MLETEYYLINGQKLISRLLPSQRINNLYHQGDGSVERVPFDPDQRLVGKIQTGKVVFETDQGDDTALAPDEIEIQVLATGLNRDDVAAISGTELSNDFSHEISGIVTNVGSGVDSFVVGDHAFGLHKARREAEGDVDMFWDRLLASRASPSWFARIRVSRWNKYCR